MHSLRGWKWLVFGNWIGRVAATPKPVVTPAPEVGIEAWVKRQQPDPASFAQVLLTAIPLSLREIAATNAPAVSSILWEQFLDDKKPQWFLDLPWDIQSYLIVEFGPETAWPTAPPQTADVDVTPTQSIWVWPSSTNAWKSSQATPSLSSLPASSAVQPSESGSVTAIVSSVLTFSTSTRSSAVSSVSRSAPSSKTGISSPASPSATSDPVSPPESNAGLSRHQKIGLGVGIPLGIVGAAALLLGCCFLLRRRRNKKHVNGAEPPSSPGFIPRFAFQDKSTDHFDHRAPLNPNMDHSNQDHGTMNWEDDGYDPYEPASFDPAPIDPSQRANTFPPTAITQVAMQNAQPVMAPVVFHTHSSNRARGKRTSYSSLHSVAELSEPDDGSESPVLGRQATPLQRKRRPSLPMVLEIPAVPRAATIKRKPVPESPTAISPAAEAASQSLLRPAMTHIDHSGSSSSGLALSTNSSTGAGYQTDMTSPVSPLSQHASTNPFSNDYSYVEDYGPEYQGGYLDHEDGLYGGNRSLDRYPDPSPPRRKSSSKTEWPLRNLSMGRRNRSPMWDRVYES
ncbi:hypothetical protein FB567DRAFT_294384 [Paraphoma chrysanthemicola]|uniref:Mid2 domain-containing protein n=1 Tax=Paraphoma chrysanthemicola TaxID=798071 RepID=A0A8K0W1G9_9PLEO|nr:hypothetical protein FB567DRAFT_294384 [Paraphoma chrysanthemicola]